MKRSFFRLYLLASLLLLSFSVIAQPVAKSKTKAHKNKMETSANALFMPGAYNLTSMVVNMGRGDSAMQLQQLKLYTDRHVLYVHAGPDDSLAEYGIGKYEVKDGKVMEYMFHSAGGGAHLDTFTLDVARQGDGYTQVINFPAENGQSFVLTENYSQAGKDMVSPLDGAWKQTEVSWMPKNGASQTNSNPTQFKVFQSGHFAWVNTQMDSATQKPVSFYGYGSFEMKDPKTLVETNSRSSYATALVGKPVTVQVKFKGRDTYQQIIESADGKQVETYQRMK
jgi:hypothetical protein